MSVNPVSNSISSVSLDDFTVSNESINIVPSLASNDISVAISIAEVYSDDRTLTEKSNIEEEMILSRQDSLINTGYYSQESGYSSVDISSTLKYTRSESSMQFNRECREQSAAQNTTNYSFVGSPLENNSFSDVQPLRLFSSD